MTGTLAHILRHPIKGHGREEMGRVNLTAGACLPFDRHWAVAHESAKLTGAWVPCVNFARGAKAQTLMAITSVLDEDARRLTLRHPDIGEITFHPDDPADLPRFLAWVAPLAPAERARPVQIVSIGRGMTDSEFPSVAILSLTTLRDLGARMGMDLSIHRWRGNLWLDGVPLRAEEDWAGRIIRIGGAVLRVEERITRCRATMADPQTGLVAGDTLAALQAAYGHQDFGVYATVLDGGPVVVGNDWVLPMSMAFPLADTPDASAHEAGRLLFAGPVDFVKGVVAMSGLPAADRLEICFAGRSNVGKSSLINALTGRKNLARASNTPGRTQEINFFALGDTRYMVDLPGYGYAEAPVAVVAKWQALLRSYLAGRQTLRRAFVLIDTRHGVKAVDEEILTLLDRSALAFQVVMTKADKVNAAERDANIEQVREALKKHPAAYPELVVTSAEKGDGIETLRAIIATLV